MSDFRKMKSDLKKMKKRRGLAQIIETGQDADPKNLVRLLWRAAAPGACRAPLSTPRDFTSSPGWEVK